MKNKIYNSFFIFVLFMVLIQSVCSNTNKILEKDKSTSGNNDLIDKNLFINIISPENGSILNTSEVKLEYILNGEEIIVKVKLNSEIINIKNGNFLPILNDGLHNVIINVSDKNNNKAYDKSIFTIKSIPDASYSFEEKEINFESILSGPGSTFSTKIEEYAVITNKESWVNLFIIFNGQEIDFSQKIVIVIVASGHMPYGSSFSIKSILENNFEIKITVEEKIPHITCRLIYPSTGIPYNIVAIPKENIDNKTFVINRIESTSDPCEN